MSLKVGHEQDKKFVPDGKEGRTKSGARWRDLPARYGNWNSIYHKFRQWCESGLFKLLLHLVNTEAQATTLFEIDSTQAIGVSRGGKNTKIHVIIDLFAGIELKGKKVLADKAYSSEKIRNYLEEHGAQICVPDKSNFKMKHFFDAELYKRRNIIERFFQRIKNYRHIATRYDKLAVCFLNFVLLASFVIHL